MCLPLFHKWEKWEQFEQNMVYVVRSSTVPEHLGKQHSGVEIWQKRKCAKCGFEQRKKIVG